MGSALAQTPGHRSFPFLEIGVGPRQLAQASLAVLIPDAPIDRMVRHPAALSWVAHRSLFVGTTRYWAGGSYYHVAYAHRFRTMGKVGFFVNYLDYGEFEGLDERGNPTRPFRGGESEVGVIQAYRWRRWSMGAAFKWVHSDLLQYKADALMGDFSVAYLSADSLWSFSATYLHLGASLRGKEAAPGDLGWSISYKFRHNPLRLYVGMRHLEVWWFSSYEEPSPVQNIEDTLPPPPWKQHLETAFRHMAGGADVVLGQGLTLRMGYHVQRRRETSLFGIRRLVGFSFGASVKVRSLWIDYTVVPAQPGHSWHAFAMRTNLEPFLRRLRGRERPIQWK